jgi:hypothetical protein
LNVLVAVLSKTDMIGMLGSHMLAIYGISDSLRRLPIREPLPVATTAMVYARRSSADSARCRDGKTVSAVARQLARPA